MEFSEWCRSMAVSLSSVNYDGYIQSRSISIVPEVLKKSKEDAYTPRAVSIGPRFQGSREDLLLMEDIKIRCMTYLFHREQHNMSAYEKLNACCEVVWNLNDQIRASYVVDINLEQHKLAKIMLVDGCFLLELLISKGFDDELPCQLKSPAPAAQLLRNEDVLSDLTLLENQIPICVLHELSRKLFRKFFEYDLKERATRINNLVLSLLGYSQLQVQSIGAAHVLDIVHFFVNRKGDMQSKTESCINQVKRTYAVRYLEMPTAVTNFLKEHNVEDIIDTQQQHVVNLKLKSCAFRLLTSGVTIEPLSEEKDKELGLSCFNLVWKSLCGVLFRIGNILVNGKHLNLNHIPEEVEVKGLDFYFKFQNGELEIEQLHITKTTKAKWCNIIAWEHHKMFRDFSRFTPSYDVVDESTSTTVSGGKFTWAALIFNGLICCADDVQLLKDTKIVVDHLKMSNQELMEFFRTIAFGVDHKVVDSSSYIQMVHDMNNYSEAFFIQRIWKIVLNSFTYHRHKWLLRFMNRNYNFVATLLSVSIVVQTVYTILAYYFPN